LAANRTPNRRGIRMENRTCRQPLTAAAVAGGKKSFSELASCCSRISLSLFLSPSFSISLSLCLSLPLSVIIFSRSPMRFPFFRVYCDSRRVPSSNFVKALLTNRLPGHHDDHDSLSTPPVRHFLLCVRARACIFPPVSRNIDVMISVR
jgi:hypothetical protein